ncbi:MAG: hypothetical protein ACTSSE_16875 [Candidatus Thorarchaeota archaeon]
MKNQKIKIVGLLLCSMLMALGVVFVSATLTSADTSILDLPGQKIEDTAFAECINESLGNQIYPPRYSISSQRPFIIHIDYQNETFISGNSARNFAWAFINDVFPIEIVNDLEIDERSVEFQSVLPRWTFRFKNSTIETPIRIVATVSINAITGAVVSYIGRETLYPQGISLDISSAEIMTMSFIKTMNFSIASDSRYTVSNYTNFDSEYFRFEFQQTSEDVLVDSVIGMFFVEFDRLKGGVRSFGYDWVPIETINTQGVTEPNVAGESTEILMLTRVSDDDISNEDTIDLQLCWIATTIQSSVPRVFVIDAFSGEIIRTMDYFGNTSFIFSTIFVIPCSMVFGFVAYLIGKKKLM